MNVIKVLGVMLLLVTMGCKNNGDYRWDIDAAPLKEDVKIIDVSGKYYDTNVSNTALKEAFPDFFENAKDSLLNVRRNDSLSVLLNQEVVKQFGQNVDLQDSLQTIFTRLKHFYPKFTVPKVYTFTGELSYEYPVAYFAETADMVIGLDWFLGEKNPNYDAMAIPDYFTTHMNHGNFKPKVVEAIAKQMVPYDIRKRKFIERMIYEGKLLIIQDALLPNATDAEKIGYTQDEINWAVTNEPQVYMYFTEEQLFFSDDKRLNQRFLDPAPFSKFFSENDTQSPGRIAAWMGWQICRAYLDKNKELSLQEFLVEPDLIKIFNESGYKPTP